MHVIITGASSGIGEAIAREFSKQKYKVTLVARRKEVLQKLASELPTATHVVAADLIDLENCTNWIDDAVAALGPIDVLINNAGMQYVEPTTGISNERAENLIKLNLLAPMRLSNYVLPTMIKNKSGSIVNISSIAAINPTPYMYHYSASKAGIGAASETLHYELKEKGVHVLTVYPGPVATPMEKAARAQIDHMLADQLPSGTPERLAQLIHKGVRKKEQRIIYPASYKVARLFAPLSQWLTGTFSPKPK